MKRILLVVLLFVATAAYAKDKIRVACVGNSVTYGYGIENLEADCYPAHCIVLLNLKIKRLMFPSITGKVCAQLTGKS